MSNNLLILVPVCFAFIHFLEFTGMMARIGGIRSKSHMLGYTIQQAVYVGTRLFMVFLMPMLGLIVDVRIEITSYQIMASFSLLCAALLSLVAYLSQNFIITYYESVISRYKLSGNFVSAFFGTSVANKGVGCVINKKPFMVFGNNEAKRIMLQSSVVFSIYGTGVFISFYIALLNFEYRASISQLSGIINATGTVLLTFYIEPRISRGIDFEREDAESLVQALLIGRLIGVGVLSQVILFFVYMVT